MIPATVPLLRGDLTLSLLRPLVIFMLLRALQIILDPYSNYARWYTKSIFELTSRYAPYDVPCVGHGSQSIRIGDFGTLDPITLQFSKKGNIANLKLTRPLAREDEELLGSIQKLLEGTAVPQQALEVYHCRNFGELAQLTQLPTEK